MFMSQDVLSAKLLNYRLFTKLLYKDAAHEIAGNHDVESAGQLQGVLAGSEGGFAEPCEAVDTIYADRLCGFATLYNQMSVTAVGIPRVVVEILDVGNRVVIADGHIIEDPALADGLAEADAGIAGAVYGDGFLVEVA